MTTLLIAEHDHEALKDVTNKALTAASQLGGDVHVLVAGGSQGTKAAAEAASKLSGVKKVLVAEISKHKFRVAKDNGQDTAFEQPSLFLTRSPVMSERRRQATERIECKLVR